MNSNWNWLSFPYCTGFSATTNPKLKGRIHWTPEILTQYSFSIIIDYKNIGKRIDSSIPFKTICYKPAEISQIKIQHWTECSCSQLDLLFGWLTQWKIAFEDWQKTWEFQMSLISVWVYWSNVWYPISFRKGSWVIRKRIFTTNINFYNCFSVNLHAYLYPTVWMTTRLETISIYHVTWFSVMKLKAITQMIVQKQWRRGIQNPCFRFYSSGFFFIFFPLVFEFITQ